MWVTGVQTCALPISDFRPQSAGTLRSESEIRGTLRFLPHLQLRQEPQGSSDFRLRSQGPCRLGTGESGLVLGRHGTPLASRDVPGERGRLSSCIWNLGVFSGRCTGGSLPLRVGFIHRVEFGEVSGHRVLTKRGPGNRGASQCGSTHEATSGMSS